MKPTIPIRNALADKKLLGGIMGGKSWHPWRVLLVAAMGEKLTKRERQTFTQLTGRTQEPLQRVEECALIVGRRGGKSRAMATLAAYIGGLCKHRLVAGERGVLLCIAPDQRQAGIVLEYAEAAFEQSPILSQLIANRTNDTLELTNGINIEVRAASFRRLRGPTYIGCIADEAAFWFSDELAANTDTEILNAVRPGLATTNGPLIVSSSPYAKRGVLFETHRKHYGPDGDPLILVAQGTTRDFNPSFPQAVIDRALERDHAAAAADYLAEFRSDLETFVSLETVRACVGDHIEIGYKEGVQYLGFMDPAGGSGGDSFTMGIVHNDGDNVVVDAIRETMPPFSPEAVIDEYCSLLKSYKIFRVTGDNFGGDMPPEMCRKRGVYYEKCKRVKSDLYRDLLPLLNSRRIILPKSDRTVNQICNLERNTGRSGKDSISHPERKGYHDDLANAVAGAAYIATWAKSHVQEQASTATYTSWFYVDDEPSETRKRLLAQGASPPCLIDFRDPKNQFHGTWKAPGFEDRFDDT